MHLNHFLDQTENLTVENKLLKFVVAVIGLTSVVSMALVFLSLRYQKTIILPPVTDRKIVVSGNDANDDYFKLYAKYITGLLLNYTPVIFDDQARDLLTLCTPSFMPSLEKKLKEIKTGVEKLSITSVFYPQKITIDRKQSRITVTGKRDHTARGELIESVRKTYIISYTLDMGRLYVNDIMEKD